MKAAINRPNPKTLGAFYTPPTVADMMADWIIRTGQERLLEPSIGGAALIDACVSAAVRKTSRGARGLRFLGCDVDPAAIAALSERRQDRLELRAVDFLQLDPTSTGKFTGVIANPPFTRNHDLDPSRRRALREKYDVVGAAGLWVHFLLHSLDFIAPNGRMAIIVPSSAMFTHYGQKALERVLARFARVDVRQFVDKPLWTNGAEERGALILCDGFGGICGSPTISHWRSNGAPHDFGPASPSFSLVEAFSSPLGSIASLSIGLVTGCNPVFLLTDAEREKYAIPKKDLVKVVTRVRQLTTLEIGAKELSALDRECDRIWLMAPKSIDERHSGIRRRLAEISRDRRRNTHWFSKRAPWWKVETGQKLDAIFTYMNDAGPKLVLVRDGISCTNTLHAVRFRPEITATQKLTAALSSISTFGQLAAERIGRVYGGGLLKFELGDARKLPVLLSGVDLERAFRDATRAASRGKWEVARDVADEALLRPLLATNFEAGLEEMTSELGRLRAIRRGTTE
ncbi:SAM-dependent DNA methyltransferase [Nostoc ellipsosporum NOK]|nr:SAM-dependent DNA methyltransferase [Nostoc ellipsosporum NOK]